MPLPYVTAGQAEKIAKKIIEEQGSSPAPTPSVNLNLVIDYTLAELLEYEDVDVPVKLQDALHRAMYNQVIDFTILTYIEIYTKDGYCFKGTNAPVPSGEGAFFNKFCLKCVTSDTVIFLTYETYLDQETGDASEILESISTLHSYPTFDFQIIDPFELPPLTLNLIADEGMSWSNWCDKYGEVEQGDYYYNFEVAKAGLVIKDSESGFLVFDNDNHLVSPSDMIEPEYSYHLGEAPL